jgi:hypothetical protein
MTGVQTKCGCGHSAAAHERGPCQGVDVHSGGGQVPGARSLVLCECPELRDTYKVPAGPALIPIGGVSC